MKTALLKEEQLEQIIEAGKNNQVIAFPTETVFGLGVKYDSSIGLEQLYQIKERCASKAITLMVYDKLDIEKFAIVDDFSRKIINAWMPGKITLILKKQDWIDDSLTANLPTIGIRIPDQPLVLKLLKEIGPMWVTSANISNQPDMVKAVDVYHTFKDQVAIVVDQDAGNDLPSTVLMACDEEIKILRQGSITQQQIMEELK